jgi:hypothetical protein
MSWSAFLRAHWSAIAAMDFFTVEAVTWTGLVRFHVLLVIDLASRRVEIVGITEQPHEVWMKQMGARPDRCRRRLPPEAPVRHHGPRPLVLSQLPRHAQDKRCEARAATVAQSQLERLRRALDRLNAARVFG